MIATVSTPSFGNKASNSSPPIGPGVPKPQARRALLRYRRRWKIERFFPWIQSFRKTTVRREYHITNFLAFVRLACVVILLRYL